MGSTIARLHFVSRASVRLLLLRNQFGLDEQRLADVSPMFHFERGNWGRVPVLLVSASSEFIVPWVNRQASMVFCPDEASLALRNGGAEVFRRTVQGCHFSFLRKAHILL